MIGQYLSNTNKMLQYPFCSANFLQLNKALEEFLRLDSASPELLPDVKRKQMAQGTDSRPKPSNEEFPNLKQMQPGRIGTRTLMHRR